MKSRSAAMATLAAMACGATAFVVAGSAASAAPQDHSQRLVLTLRYADATTTFTGKDPDHPTIGDRFIDAAPARSAGKVVGRATSVCTIVSGDSEKTFITQCTSTFTLPRGELITAGADDSSDETTDAIIGGTAAFTYASGTATTVSGADAATITLRFSTSR